MELYIQSESIPKEQLIKLAREMLIAINKEKSITAKEKNIPASELQGSNIDNVIGVPKSDAITTGQLLLTFLGGGSAVALFDVIKAFVSRSSRISIELRDPQGSIIKFSSENVNSNDRDAFIDKIKTLSLPIEDDQ